MLVETVDLLAEELVEVKNIRTNSTCLLNQFRKDKFWMLYLKQLKKHDKLWTGTLLGYTTFYFCIC